MPKRVPVEAKRVPLNCLVAPATLEWLKASGCSQGEMVDRAVWTLRAQEIKDEAASVNAEPLPGVVGVDLHEDLWNKIRPRSFKPPLLKPSEKKK